MKNVVDNLEIRKRIGEALKDERKKKDISQVGLAQTIGISRDRLVKIEKGQRPINAELLCQIGNALAVSIDHLLRRPLAKESEEELLLLSGDERSFTLKVLEWERFAQKRRVMSPFVSSIYQTSEMLYLDAMQRFGNRGLNYFRENQAMVESRREITHSRNYTTFEIVSLPEMKQFARCQGNFEWLSEASLREPREGGAISALEVIWQTERIKDELNSRNIRIRQVQRLLDVLNGYGTSVIIALYPYPFHSRFSIFGEELLVIKTLGSYVQIRDIGTVSHYLQLFDKVFAECLKGTSVKSFFQLLIEEITKESEG